VASWIQYVLFGPKRLAIASARRTAIHAEKATAASIIRPSAGGMRLRRAGTAGEYAPYFYNVESWR
jgi:hypothetical protein